MRNKILLKLVCMFIASIIICVFCLKCASYEEYIVPGTVFSKNTEQYAYGKHYRNMSTRYIMCVKPDDTSKFKHYSLYVDYSTYCTHNVGDKVTFSVSENKCLKGFKRSKLVDVFYVLTLISFGILSIFLFVAIILVIVFKAIKKSKDLKRK